MGFMLMNLCSLPSYVCVHMLYSPDHMYTLSYLVLIWDDVSRKFVYEYGFPSSVLSVRMRRDK